MTKHIGIYHNPCPDGLTAAWVFQKYMLDNDLEFKLTPGAYSDGKAIDLSDIEEELEDSIVYFLDFCTKDPAQLIEIASKARQVFVLDHHKTAAEMLEGMDVPSNVDVDHITMEDSGALITWNYFYPTESAPLFVKYISDNDTWKHELPGVIEFMAWFDLMEPATTADIFNLVADFPKTPSEFAEASQYRRGKVALKFKKILIEQCEGLAFETEICGVKVMKVNSGFIKINSQLGNNLVEKHKMPAWVWYERMGANGPEIYNSIRSNDDLHDATEIAKQFGGGGHRNAAGFIGRPE
ncbi:MAG: hypothetical protein ACYTKD_16935 [Planctomycetota bacterium]|jgi:oligoribonuclease NrnB/cAMP/cGMP phosphodiesterase (DHH superfamily)